MVSIQGSIQGWIQGGNLCRFLCICLVIFLCFRGRLLAVGLLCGGIRRFIFLCLSIYLLLFLLFLHDLQILKMKLFNLKFQDPMNN